MGRRYELSDVEWDALSRYLPSVVTGGRPRVDDRRVLNGIVWKIRAGAAWRDVPARYGSWALLIDTSVLEQILQRPVNASDCLTLAWITSSLATVGGAMGSGLENEETVWAAAYGYHPQSGGWRDERGRARSSGAS